MTVESIKMVETQSAKVAHSFPNDPTWGSFVTLIQVEGDQVRVGTPLVCITGLSLLEIYSVVQLILNRPVTLKAEPVDTIALIGETGCPREWKTYELSV